MNRFIKDVKKYYKYAIYAARSDLKSEVASSYLNWLWWLLDPLFFMMIYAFVSIVVFDAREQYFNAFVFIGLTVWDFFNRSVVGSVKIVQANSAIVTKVYIPKYVLILVRMLVNSFKMYISFGLVLIMMIIYKVPFTFKIIYFIPVILTLYTVTFGVCTIISHFGVFVEDLSNVINIILKLIFYLSGIFYSVEKRVPVPYNMYMIKCNPIAYLINELRRVMLYDLMPYRKLMLLWFCIGIVLSVIGVRIIYKYENSYVKVI
jgi:ABC-type polysaccharide/polyol phosphate export systems, permease component